MSADRNLVFGLLALQMNFVSREQLLDGMHAWMLERHTPLGELLSRRGALAAANRDVLELVVSQHIKHHGGVEASLGALAVTPDVRDSLASLPSVAESYVSVASPIPRFERSRYRPLRPHAKGGLGEVSVALDEELKREVALKEIQDRFADHPDARARFVREAEITGHLEHPGVVPVYGLSSYPDGRPYYAMRFIRGESMHEAIGRFHRADESRRDLGERRLALGDLRSADPKPRRHRTNGGANNDTPNPALGRTGRNRGLPQGSSSPCPPGQ